MALKARLKKLAKAVTDLNYLTTNKLFGNNEVYTNAKEQILKEAKKLNLLPQVRATMVCYYK